MEHVRYAAKAIAALVVSFATGALFVLSGDMTFADLTTVQWLTLTLYVFGGPAAVYTIENGDKPTGEF